MAKVDEKITEYIKQIERELESLEVKVNPDKSISGKSCYIIDRNGDRALELTAQLKGFKDALELLHFNLQV